MKLKAIFLVAVFLLLGRAVCAAPSQAPKLPQCTIPCCEPARPLPPIPRKPSPCSPFCECGCNEGEACRCGNPLSNRVLGPALAPLRLYQPAQQRSSGRRAGGGC